MKPKEKKYKMPPKQKPSDFTDPNMTDEHQSSPAPKTAPSSDNFNDGVWPGAQFIRSRIADEEGGYNLPTINVPDEPDDYSN